MPRCANRRTRSKQQVARQSTAAHATLPFDRRGEDMENIDSSSSSTGMDDGMAMANGGRQQAAAPDVDRVRRYTARGVAGFWIRVTCSVALWALVSRLLADVFASAGVAALVGLWIALNGVFVVNAVVATLWRDRE
jgi:hypothetical protein